MTDLPEWRLVTHKSPRGEHLAVARLDKRVSEAEWHTMPFGWEPDVAMTRPDWEAWLYGPPDVALMIYVRECRVEHTEWYRARGWVDPDFRRRGIISAGDRVSIARYKAVSTHASLWGNPRNDALDLRGWKHYEGPWWTLGRQ